MAQVEFPDQQSYITYEGTDLRSAADIQIHIRDGSYSIQHKTARRHGLTPMELRVLALGSIGLTHKQVAAGLDLSDSTTDTYVSHARRRLRAHTGSALSDQAFKRGIFRIERFDQSVPFLPRRERSILDHISSGVNHDATAESMFISLSAVKSGIASIRDIYGLPGGLAGLVSFGHTAKDLGTDTRLCREDEAAVFRSSVLNLESVATLPDATRAITIPSEMLARMVSQDDRYARRFQASNAAQNPPVAI